MKILLFANTAWYLYNFRLSLAQAIREAGAEVVMVSPHDPFGARLEDEGFRWIPAPMDRRSLNPLRELRLLGRLTAIYRREQPDLAHHFTLKCVVYGAVAARIAGVNASVGAVTGLGHVFCSDTPRARLLRPFVRMLVRHAMDMPRSGLIVQNPDDRALFLEHALIRPERLRVIRGSGVNTVKFTPRASTSPSRPFRVLMATRMLWEKGVGEYMETARLLRPRYPRVEFLLAGGPDQGNPASVPESHLADWNRTNLVRCLGHVAKIDELLAEVDLVVLPSYREGAPRILLETAAAGLPIVTTDVPGCREVVRHGVNGLLVPPRDAPALADAIASLIEHPERGRKMGLAGRNIALAEFDESIVIRRTLDVYRELMPSFRTAQADCAGSFA